MSLNRLNDSFCVIYGCSCEITFVDYTPYPTPLKQPK